MMFSMSDYKALDLKDVIENYSPKLAKSLPKFIYRWLSKTLHLNQINNFIEKTKDDNSLQFMEDCVKELDLKLKFTGLERLEKIKGQDKIIFVANHPIGGPEGVALMSQVLKYMPNAKIMIQKFLSIFEPMKEVAIFNGSKLSTSLEAVKQGVPIVIFPAGYCSRRILPKGGIYDFEWKATFVKIAKRYGYKIQPVFISGKLSNRMYRFYNLRKLFKITTSIETLFLIDEMYKFSGNELSFTFGSLIEPTSLSNEVDVQEWSHRIRQYVKSLEKNPKLDFNPNIENTLPVIKPFEDLVELQRQAKKKEQEVCERA